MQSLFQKISPAKGMGGRLKTLTSFGTALDQDDHIVHKIEDDDEEEQQLHLVCTLTSGSKSNRELEEKKPEPKVLATKDWGIYLILRSRFGWHTENKRTVWKRKDDLLKDLNLDMLSGKTKRESYFFDEENSQT